MSPQHLLPQCFQHPTPKSWTSGAPVPQDMLPDTKKRDWIYQVRAEIGLGPQSNPTDKSIYDSQDLDHCCASAAVGPEPRGCEPERSSKRAPGGSGASIVEAVHSLYSQHPQVLTLLQLILHRQFD